MDIEEEIKCLEERLAWLTQMIIAQENILYELKDRKKRVQNEINEIRYEQDYKIYDASDRISYE